MKDVTERMMNTRDGSDIAEITLAEASATRTAGLSSGPRLIARLGLVIFVALLGVGCGKTEDEALAEARGLLLERNVLGATIAYQDFLRRYPESELTMAARFGLAECYYMDREYADSREVLDVLIEQAGGTSTVPGLNAVDLKIRTYLEEREPLLALEEALRTSETLGTHEADTREFFHMRIADLMRANDRKDDAVVLYQSILRREPTSQLILTRHFAALQNLTAIHFGNEDLPAALASFTDYLERFPEAQTASFAHKNAGKILLEMERKEEAFEQFEASLEDNRKEADIEILSERIVPLLFDQAESLYLLERKEEGRDTLKRIVDEYNLPEVGRIRAMAMFQLAQDSFDDGDVESALATLSQASKDYPNTEVAQQAQQLAQQMQASRLGEITDAPEESADSQIEPAGEQAAESAEEPEAREPADSEEAGQAEEATSTEVESQP